MHAADPRVSGSNNPPGSASSIFTPTRRSIIPSVLSAPTIHSRYYRAQRLGLRSLTSARRRIPPSALLCSRLPGTPESRRAAPLLASFAPLLGANAPIGTFGVGLAVSAAWSRPSDAHVGRFHAPSGRCARRTAHLMAKPASRRALAVVAAAAGRTVGRGPYAAPYAAARSARRQPAGRPRGTRAKRNVAAEASGER